MQIKLNWNELPHPCPYPQFVLVDPLMARRASPTSPHSHHVGPNPPCADVGLSTSILSQGKCHRTKPNFHCHWWRMCLAGITGGPAVTYQLSQPGTLHCTPHGNVCVLVNSPYHRRFHQPGQGCSALKPLGKARIYIMKCFSEEAWMLCLSVCLSLNSAHNLLPINHNQAKQTY